MIIRKSKITGIVVEFTGLTSGVVIACGNIDNPVGTHSDTWYDWTRSDRWQKIESKRVILHNKIKDFK